MRELINRAEAIERRAWSALFHAAPTALRMRLKLQAAERWGVTLLSAAAAPHLLLNRAIGVGAAEEPPVARVVAHYRDLGIEQFWVHVGSEQRYTALPALLRAHGVVPYPRSWMKFVRGVGSVDNLHPSVRVAGRDDADAVSRLIARGFELPSNAGSLFRGALLDPRWHVFVVDRRPEPAAAGALFVHGEDGYLAFAATSSDARNRGFQRALLAARIERARELGCRRVFSETGLPVPGEPNSSYRNMLRLGFDELCVRDNFAPEGTRWSSQASSDENRSSPGSPTRSETPRAEAARSGS